MTTKMTANNRPVFKWTAKTLITERYETQRFGNMLSDTFQAEVVAYTPDDGAEKTYTAWAWNRSRNDAEFEMGFTSLRQAKRWARKTLLRMMGY